MLDQLRFKGDRSIGGSRGNFFLCGLMCLGMVGSGLSCSTASRSFGVGSPKPTAEVTTRREGSLIRVNVENAENSEVTVTFAFSSENLKSTVTFPHTATFKPGQTEAFTLAPIQPDAPWHYSCTNYFRLGSSDALHDDAVVYQLPYAPGRNFKVS